jgi:hypothetical protein
MSEHGSGRLKARKPCRSQWRCCTELLYFSAVRTERPICGVRHTGQVLKRLDPMHPGVPSIHAPVVCSEPVVHLVNLHGGDRVSDEAYEPLTSNRAVENAAISFFRAYEQVHGRGVPTREEVLHLAGGYACVRDSTTLTSRKCRELDRVPPKVSLRAGDTEAGTY